MNANNKVKLEYLNDRNKIMHTEIVTVTSVKQINNNLVNVTFAEKNEIYTYTNNKFKSMINS